MVYFEPSCRQNKMAKIEIRKHREEVAQQKLFVCVCGWGGGWGVIKSGVKNLIPK